MLIANHTIEDRLTELEAMVAALRRDVQAKPERKFKVGDSVLIVGTVDKVDEYDTEGLPYRVAIGSGEDKDVQWLPESDLTEAP